MECVWNGKLCVFVKCLWNLIMLKCGCRRVPECLCVYERASTRLSIYMSVRACAVVLCTGSAPFIYGTSTINAI